jgi:hypothetical protein
MIRLASPISFLTPRYQKPSALESCMIYFLLVLIIVLQWSSYHKLRRIEKAVAGLTESGRVLAKGLDWIDGNLARCLGEYQGYGD